MSVSEYNGDSTQYDWILNSGNITTMNGSVALTLTESNGGTRLSLTRYVHYGSITARMKASKWIGMVTAFITMSDIADEIDFEWPGNNTSEVQTNFFWQGIAPVNDDHSAIIEDLEDVFDNWHDYTIDWQPDILTWLVDDKPVHSINRSSYESDGVSRFPNTPSQVEISLWPAGISGQSEGIIEWTDGMINWNDTDYLTNGYFYAMVDAVSVKCADVNSTAPAAGDTSYVYGTNSSALTPGIEYSSRSTLLGASS